MEESLRLSTEQKLQQRLTPLQVQFVKMLEMTGPEVEEEVRRALDDNPALEQCDNDDNNNLTEDSTETFNESAEEVQLADYRDEDDIPSYRLEARNHSADDKYFEPIAVDSSGDTLIETLNSQLMEFDLDETQQAIAQYIIGNLDDNGYMTRDLNAIIDDLAFNVGIDVSITYLKQIFNIVRSLEPAGVGAIDLRDCLLLQLRRKEQSKLVAIATDIIDNYFDLFSKMHYDRLRSILNLSIEELKEVLAVITSLNPKPGSIITGGISDSTRHIIPDFSIEVNDNEEITLTLLNRIPELQIEETFSESACEIKPNATRSQREAATFIKQKRDEASGFIKILKMRQETLYQVMKAIVKLQHDFFLTDDESRIRPMILKDIAAITGHDLSVISRATAGKYVMTQRGTYPLKLFFNERPKEDDDTSSHEILAVLKDIISNENKKKPLSDEAITQILVDKGYDIARRTVAKYRERLGLPVARLRKEL
ncbi:MAG: RNA polymerase factor sigma-54 [Muribaculaceae bacterium]|nr:RNA polymerase factor sigma-54 [Muribaculaceae bacterium]